MAKLATRGGVPSHYLPISRFSGGAPRGLKTGFDFRSKFRGFPYVDCELMPELIQPEMQFPRDEDRMAIVGATGSGKTVGGMWHLSLVDFHLMPWIIYDFKRDSHVNSIPHAQHIGLDVLPSAPGVYIVHPRLDEEEEIENQLWHIWERGNTGVFIDEGYMIGQHNKAYRALLTQGRSKQIPMIVLCQRPRWMDTFTFSEAQFLQVYRLAKRADREAIEEDMPDEIQMSERLPKHWSYYYDVVANTLLKLSPVPPIEDTLRTFERRLRRRRIAA